MIKNKNMTRWGILGCGNIAALFAKDLAAIDNAKLYAVAGRSLDKTQAFAEQFSNKSNNEKDMIHCYGNYHALVQDPHVDVIYIATPHILHYENTMMCLEHNKAVLCEKPFAMNTAQVNAMIALAKQKNVFLMEALWTSFLPQHKYVLQVIHSQQLGKVKKLSAAFGFASLFDASSRLFNKSLGGGSLLDVGIYPIFAALSILGMPAHIEACATFASTGVDNDCNIVFNYPQGISANLSSSIVSDIPTVLKVECEHGIIEVEHQFYQPSRVLIKSEQKKLQEKIDFTETLLGYHHQIIHVQNMMQEGYIESSIMNFSTSQNLIGLLDTIRKKIGLTYDADSL